jgi:hypothetical protein
MFHSTAQAVEFLLLTTINAETIKGSTTYDAHLTRFAQSIVFRTIRLCFIHGLKILNFRCLGCGFLGLIISTPISV